jgi:PD-(D/E)XK nuclease superfamily protein
MTLKESAAIYLIAPCGRKEKRGYREDAEFFGVYSPEVGQVYLILVEAVPEGQAYLRLKQTRNNQEKRIVWAKDYEL